MQELARAGDGFAGKPLGQIARQTDGGAGVRQRFGEQKDVSRSGARQRRHRIHQVLVIHPFHRAGRAEQKLRDAALSRIGLRRDRDRDAASDRGRGIGHRPHHGAGTTKYVREKAQGTAGHDRDDQGGRSNVAGESAKHFVSSLRLYGDDDHIGLLQGRGAGIEPNAALRERAQIGQRLRLNHDHFARIKTEPQPALQQRTAHFAGANKRDQTGEIAQARLGVRGCGRICSRTCLGFFFRTRPRAAHASPVVSNIADSIASRADFPAQMTNWKAGK